MCSSGRGSLREWWTWGAENGHWVLIVSKEEFRIGFDAWGYREGELKVWVQGVIPEPPSLTTAHKIAEKLYLYEGTPTLAFVKAIQRCLRDLRREGVARSVPDGEGPQLGWLLVTAVKKIEPAPPESLTSTNPHPSPIVTPDSARRNGPRLGVIRPKEEWIAVSVPPIVSEKTFQRVQSQLALRSPKITPGRLINSPVLLTGIVRCGGCNAAMRRETGKGGRYHYYRCSTLKRTGSCNGKPTVAGVVATQLDEIVLSKIADQLLTPERVKAIISEVAAKRDAGIDQATTALRQLREQRTKTGKKLSNLMKALADGMVEASETFKATLQSNEAEAKRIDDLITVQERILSSRMKEVTLEEAAEFAVSFRGKLLSCGPALKKRIIRSFVAEVIVSEDEIIIHGDKSDLAEIVTGGSKND
jgi:hypothetical protein